MPDPVLHLIAGPNGAGKTTFYEKVLGPTTNLAFVNTDVIAEERWPGAAVEHGYDASAIAAGERTERIRARTSFATETVFSHESKLALIQEAQHQGYRVTLHIVLIPRNSPSTRVVNRVTEGGHHVPEEKDAPGSAACGFSCTMPSRWSAKHASTTTPWRTTPSDWSRPISTVDSSARRDGHHGLHSYFEKPARDTGGRVRRTYFAQRRPFRSLSCSGSTGATWAAGTSSE